MAGDSGREDEAINTGVLKGLVVAMAVLIIAGLAVIGVTIANRLQGIAAAPWDPVWLPMVNGERLEQMTAIGDRLAMHIASDLGSRVVVVDPANGRVVGEFRLSSTP